VGNVGDGGGAFVLVASLDTMPDGRGGGGRDEQRGDRRRRRPRCPTGVVAAVTTDEANDAGGIVRAVHLTAMPDAVVAAGEAGDVTAASRRPRRVLARDARRA
jgi:hypothetical protein